MYEQLTAWIRRAAALNDSDLEAEIKSNGMFFEYILYEFNE
jgi:hypothetical protein